MKKILQLLLISYFFGSVAYALDKQGLAQHLRESLGLDSRTNITISSEPAPAGIGNLQMIQVNIGGGNYPVYISQDDKKYIWGQLNDLTESPDLENTKLISEQTGHSVGSKTAPITVVEYSDLQCGYCKKAHQTIKADLHKNYTKDQVRLVFKHFPLNMHPWAVEGAVGTECAAEQKEEAYWGMLDMIFKNNETISTATVRGKMGEYAKTMGLDTAAFDKCLSNPAIIQKVQDSRAEGAKLGVHSTPTIYVNGRVRKGFRSFDDLKVVIDEKLKQKK